MSDGVLKYGGSGTVTVSSGNDNFAGAAINGLSLCCTPIELLANDDSETVLGTATGFFLAVKRATISRHELARCFWKKFVYGAA